MEAQEKGDGKADVVKSSVEDNSSGNSDHDFTTKTWREDFCFIVEDKRLYVAKLILGLASPVFERMFQAEFKEKGEAEMTLPGKKFEDMREFLRCIYPSVMKDVTIKNAHQIVALAEEYQVTALKSKCEACFLSSIDTKSSAKVLYRLIEMASLYSLQDLLHKCTTLAAEKSLADLDEAEVQTAIPSAAKIVIQREIINKMEATQVKTNQTVDNLNNELQRALALYNYHRVGIPKNERLNFDDYKDWNGTSVYLKIDTSKYRPYVNTCEHTYVVDISGTPIKLEFKFTEGYFRLFISVPEAVQQQSKIKLVGKVVVVNGLKGKEDFCKMVKSDFDRSLKMEWAVLKEDTALGSDGYTCKYHGEMGVEAHLIVLRL